MKMLPLCFALVASTAFAAGVESPWRALPATTPSPASNPATPAKVELGRLLFHDKRLSESDTVSCASCHALSEGGAGHKATSTGVHGEPGGRNAPTVWNVGFLTSYYWDGRAPSLEDQVRTQLHNPIDMGMKDAAYVAARIRSIPGYLPYFERAFGGTDAVTEVNIAKAIAAFERTLVTPDSPYDRYVNGDKTALSEQQLRGMASFRADGCGRCHQGPAFDGPALAAGTVFTMKFPTNVRSPFVATYALVVDQGRIEWTGKDADRYQWRVPSLRNLKYTAPYMHNGLVPTLADAVRVMGSTELSKTFSDAEVADLVSFLEALSGPLPVVPAPALP
jgi:cytochrome c peroxidase